MNILESNGLRLRIAQWQPLPMSFPQVQTMFNTKKLLKRIIKIATPKVTLPRRKAKRA